MVFRKFAGKALRVYRKAGYPGYKSALNTVHKYHKPIAGALAAGAGAYGLSKFAKNRKKKSIHQKAINIGTPGSFSTFYYGKRKVPRGYNSVKAALAKNYKVLNGSQRCISSVGLQSANTLFSMFNQTDLIAMSALVNTSKTNRYLAMSCTAEVMITNQELSSVRVTLYDVISRRDCSSALINLPDVAWRNSYADEGGVNTNYSIIGTNPFSYDTFVQFYKVLKATHIELSQGQTHTHRIRFQPNRVIDYEQLQYIPFNLKGLTCFTMLVAHGYPQNDITTKSQVSTGAVALDVVWRLQYKFTWMNDNDTNYSTTNALPGAFTVNPNIVDIGSGSVVTDSAA